MALKKKTPCFHRTIIIQIDIPLPQGVTQAVYRRSGVALQIKSPPNLILPLLSVILDSFKKETPYFHRTILILIDSPLPRVSLKKFQDDLMLNYKIKALQKLIHDQFCH